MSDNTQVGATGGEEARVVPVPFPIRLTGEAISVAAMALATLALGTGLYLHGGFEPWAAAATAVAAYVCMLAAHAMMPRYFSVEPYGADTRGEYDAVIRQPAQDAGLGTVHSTRGAARQSAGGAREPMPDGRTGMRTMSQPHSERGPKPQPAPQGSPSSAASGKPDAVGVAPRGRIVAPPNAPATPSVDAPVTNNAPAPSSTGASVAATKAQGTTPRRAAIEMPPQPREADVEMIQGLIKKLAEEVNAANGTPAETKSAAAKVSERAITQSVDALKATADTMREQDDAAAGRRQDLGAGGLAPDSSEMGSSKMERSETGRSPAVNQRLSAMAEAFAMGRVEILLDPILDFNASRARHFEIHVRLRDEAGLVLSAQEAGADLKGTGMLSRLDGAKVENASQIAMRFAGSGRDAQVFSTVSGEALTANKFLDGVAHAYRQRDSFAGQLVMTFGQDDVRGFGAREWRTLADFARLGFRYGIADVNDLDMDFEDLKAKGFDFVKFDADVFLRGLAAGNDAFVPAADICKHLAGLGLSVIVGRIEDQNMAAKVFGFGVLLGQGTLFGGAKAVKREVLAAGGTAAA